MHDWDRRYREIADLWCSQDWETWATTAAETYTFEPGLGPSRDLAGTLEWSRAAFIAFPDFRQVIETIIVNEQTVTGITWATGTFAAPLATPGGAIRPTGDRFTVPFVKVLELDGHGRVLRDRQYMDYLQMTGGNQPQHA